MKVLIVDDDAVSRMILETTLRKLGHEVIVTSDGLQAWNAWREGSCPVLVSDWVMPVLDGLDLCRAIRDMGDANYTYFIILTSHSGKSHYLEAMEAGVDDFLTKPLEEDQLRARLRVAERILGLRQHVKQLEGMLPICACCKKVRDEDGNWGQMEAFISERSEARFSHGYCPECEEKAMKELGGKS